MPKLTVTLITRDEAAHIGAAMASVAWADEILVVDSGSSDDTVSIARRLGARVESRDWPGYIDQKNHAASLASHDWILSLDADERVDERLARDIRALMTSEPPAPAYRMRRVSFYLGRWIRTTDWYPNYQLRLYDRRRARWTGRYVHEGVSVDGPVGRLTGELLHYSYRDLSHHLRKLEHYATLSARQLDEEGRRGSIAGGAARAAAAFARNYVLKGGFRQGSVGLLISVLNGYYVFLKFAKLWERQRAGPSTADAHVRPPG